MIETDSRLSPLTLADSDGGSALVPDPASPATLVYFMRTTTCPACNRHVRRIRERADELAARNVPVFIAVPEDAAEAAEWKTENPLPFRLLVSDQGATPHSRVGLIKPSPGALQQSGTLLVAADGTVLYALGADVPTGAYDDEALTAALDRVPAGA